MRYRAEIDGLRAIAVVPVILFHAGFSMFSGGYVGVDVFFVISGYLITTIILSDLAADKFSIIHFYERRARRILPALFFVLLACLPFAWLCLLPYQLNNFSQGLAAVSVFASNILFWRTSGYFDVAAELNPLLHTWSLAVEEQYYVIFPVLLMFTWRFGKRWMVALLAVLAIASLMAAHWGSLAHPIPTFYLLPTRGWELLIGAFVAFYFSNNVNQNISNPICQIGSVLGALLLIYAMFAFDVNTPFPSLYTLLPTVGTALLILFATQQTYVGRALGNRLLVSVGLISYSAYLWHQPLFAFARQPFFDAPSELLLGLLALVAIVLAYFSWKYVEMPFRSATRVNRKQIFVFGLFGSLFFVAAGLMGYLSDGFKHRLPPNLVWESLGEKRQENGNVCTLEPVIGFPGVLSCEFGDKSAARSIFLYGDSHSLAISDELSKSLLAAKTKGIRIALEDCEVVPQMRSTSDLANLSRDCSDSFDRLLAYVEQNNGDIIVASRWTFMLYPVKGDITDLSSVNSEGGKERNVSYRKYGVLDRGKLSMDGMSKRRALVSFIDGLLSTDVLVYFIHPVPEISWDIASLNFNYYVKNNRVLDEISIPHADFTERNSFVNEIFSDFETHPNFIAVKPESIFCDTFVEGRCVAQYDTIPFYYDDDHLSDVGAGFLVEEIMDHAMK